MAYGSPAPNEQRDAAEAKTYELNARQYGWGVEDEPADRTPQDCEAHGVRHTRHEPAREVKMSGLVITL